MKSRKINSVILCLNILLLLILAGLCIDYKNQEIVPNDRISEKTIIGETEYIYFPKHKVSMLARIDTGAQSSSINAHAISIQNPSKNPKENIGKQVTFHLINGENKEIEINKTISNYKRVKTSEGSTNRYYVIMNIELKGKKQDVEVSLNDRSHMSYKMLIGRNALINNFIVDVTP